MGISRREALKLAGAAAVGGLVAGEASAASGRDASLYPGGVPGRWPIVQGATDRTAATFVVLAPSPASYAVEIGAGGIVLPPPRVVSRLDLRALDVSVIEIQATGLTPGRDYTLTVRGDDGAVIDRRLFRTLDTDRQRGRFVVASCMDEGYRRKAITMWEALAREAPDFVVLLGDTCYADRRNPARDEAGMARRYVDTRLGLAWFRMERLVPTLAVWDDHDLGGDNGDRTFVHLPFARQLFDAFWGTTANAAWRRGLGVGSRFEGFGQRFYLMDDRTFRDPIGTASGRQWGVEQMDWLFDEIGTGTMPAWIMSGGQYFGLQTLRESMEGDQPAEHAELMSRLSRVAAPAAFMSGDVHFSAIADIGAERLGYPTFEFTSSSIHSTVHPGPIDRGKSVAERRHNFLTFDVDARSGWDIDVRCILEGGVEAFARTVSIGR
ncbi:MAG: alkaline phosphatase D family protein [Bauldia sp.]